MNRETNILLFLFVIFFVFSYAFVKMNMSKNKDYEKFDFSAYSLPFAGGEIVPYSESLPFAGGSVIPQGTYADTGIGTF